MKKLNFYMIIPGLIFLFMASCSQSETVEPVFPEEIPSEALPQTSYETPLDSVLTRSDRFLGQMFLETRSSSVNRQADIHTLYRAIGAQTRSGETEEVPVHIVNYTTGTEAEPAGYVILIGDERIDEPVVAYSDGNNWVQGTIPAFEEMFLERLDNYILTGIMSYEGNSDEPIIGECQLEEEHDYGYTEKVIPMNTAWAQSVPYNIKLSMCPTHGMYMLTGCTATAMAQIMAFWKHPSSGNYISPVNGQTLRPSYNWTTMTSLPNALFISTEGQEMVAHLMAEIGYKTNTSYVGCDFCEKGGGTNINKAGDGFKSMGYRNVKVMENSFSVQTVTRELAANRLVYMGGTETNGGTDGHAWVVNGYQHTYTFYQSILTCESPTHYIEPEIETIITNTYYLRFNMGGIDKAVDGFYNAQLYAMPGFTYQYRLGMITNIYPS